VSIQVINPLRDKRWVDFVAHHPNATVFHDRGWLEALVRTYSYTPFVLTSSQDGKPLTDGIVLCVVSSWITGKRAVSLPFADHCEPLVDVTSSHEFSSFLRTQCANENWKYVELRPLSRKADADWLLGGGRSYYFHTLDLTPTREHLFRGLHRDCVQRKILRAEREKLVYEAGCSQELVNDFYRLLVRTRKRHQMVPQPLAWFRNLIQGLEGKVTIRLARKDNLAVAALLTLKHRRTVVYKYGCSDERSHHLGGVQLLFWRLVEESKADGAEEIDFGRSGLDQQGLITFKDRFGTSKKLLSYLRYAPRGDGYTTSWWSSAAIRGLFGILPDAILPSVGRALYRHIG
jgi:hypothetical protein